MNDLTLTQRMTRLENFLLPEAEIGGDKAQQVYDRIMTDRASRSGVVGRCDYREGQDERNLDVRIATAKITEPHAPTAFEDIISRIQTCTDRVRFTAGNLEQIGNRIMGEIPQAGSRDQKTGRGPDGTLDHALLALDWLDESLSRLEAAALRFERI